MATDDVQRLVVGTAPAPAQFTIPGNGQMQPKCVRAVYDGTGAGSAFLPVLRFISDGGKQVGSFVAPQVAAGGSADVSWFPHVGAKAAAATAGVPAYASVNFGIANAQTAGAGAQITLQWFAFSTSDTSLFFTTDNVGGNRNMAGNTLLHGPSAGLFQIRAQTRWAAGVYNRTAFINVPSGNEVAWEGDVEPPEQAATSASLVGLNSLLNPVSERWVLMRATDSDMQAFVSATNGDGANPHNVNYGWMVVYYWPVSGMTQNKVYGTDF